MFKAANIPISIPVIASPATRPDDIRIPLSIAASRLASSLLNFLSTSLLIIPPKNMALFRDIGR